MRKLLNVLFVVSEDSYLSLEGENVVVKRGKTSVARFPLHTLEGICIFSYAGASPALMGECAKRSIILSFFTPNGRFLARTCGITNGNVLLRREQYRIADDEEKSLKIAKGFISAKLYNSKWVLERATRDHALRVDVDKIKDASGIIQSLLSNGNKCENLDELRGIEGKAAVVYFETLDQLILQNKETFQMNGRSRRPPMDPMNALLSYIYTLLANECASALESVGLDSFVGFMHTDRPGRRSLSLDLMEELRPVVADRFALTLINRQTLSKKHFRKEGAGGVFLNDDGRKIVLNSWQEKKREEIKHPFIDEKISWGLAPYVQALLMARCIRGDIEGYPPFFWK